jgi:hypothetical protein
VGQKILLRPSLESINGTSSTSSSLLRMSVYEESGRHSICLLAIDRGAKGNCCSPEAAHLNSWSNPPEGHHSLPAQGSQSYRVLQSSKPWVERYHLSKLQFFPPLLEGCLEVLNGFGTLGPITLKERGVEGRIP